VDVKEGKTWPSGEQKQKNSDLKLKIKLLFTEFDNGEFFKDRVVSIDEDKWLELKKEDEPFKQYKHVLSLFIEHINEFKK